MNNARAFGWGTAFVGLWEVLAPFVFNYPSGAGADAVLIGGVLLIFGIWAAIARTPRTVRSVSLVDAFLGVWLILAPFVIAYDNVVGAMVNDFIVGAVVAVFETWAAIAAGKDADKVAT